MADSINNSAGTNPELMPIDPTEGAVALPEASFVTHRTSYGRSLIIAAAALTITTFLLMQFGGFDRIGKFLGANASTTQTITLAGHLHLAGDEYAEKPQWLVPGIPAKMDGVEVFDSFPSAPGVRLADNPPGIIVPVFGESEGSTNEHTYESPVVNLGGEETTLQSVKIVNYPGLSTAMSFSYRSGPTLEATISSTFIPLETVAMPFEGSEQIKVNATGVEIPAGQYVQFRVDFGTVDSGADVRPAVYAFTIDFLGGEIDEPLPDTTTDGTDDGTDATIDETITQPPVEQDRTVTIQYQTEAPISTDITVYSTAELNPVVYSIEDINLHERLSYTFEAKLTDGSYAALLEGTGYEPKVVVFELKPGITQLAVDAGEFKKANLDILRQADLNGDGKVNAIDVGILLEQYGLQEDTP